MNIKLNVNKNTFVQYLLELGYNYKIKQYEDFIGKIGKSIQEKVKAAILEDRLDETINIIFEKEVGVGFISNWKKTTYVKPSYMVSEIESGVYDLYLEENGYIIDNEVKKAYYIKDRINGLIASPMKDILINSVYKGLFKKNTTMDKKIKRISDKKLLEIGYEEKEEYDKEIKKYIVGNKNAYYSADIFEIKEDSFNYGTKLKINFNKIESYFENDILGKIDFKKRVEEKYRIVSRNEEVNGLIREYLDKKMTNIKESNKERFQDLLCFLYSSEYNRFSYITSLFNYIKNNVPQEEKIKIKSAPYYESKDFSRLIQIISRIKGFEYFKEIEEELKNLLSVISFDLIVENYQGEDIILTFEEMLEKGFIDNSEVFKLGKK